MGSIRIISDGFCFGDHIQIFDAHGKELNKNNIAGLSIELEAGCKAVATVRMHAPKIDIEAVRKNVYQDDSSPIAIVCFWEGKPVSEMTGEDCKDALDWIQHEDATVYPELYNAPVFIQAIADRMQELERSEG
jgi:hypothetical protein